jgi:hypothetical protein
MSLQKNTQMQGTEIVRETISGNFEREVDTYKSYEEISSDARNNADGCFSVSSDLSYGK